MPKIAVSRSQLFQVLGRELNDEQLREALFRTKVELDGREGEELRVEVTPDRLDLLNEGGLAWELQGSLGLAEGLPYAPEARPLERVELRANDSVAPLRPEVALAVVVAPPGQSLQAPLVEELVRFQELLHASVGRDRRAASLGLYPLERLRPPFHYALESPGQVSFTPLGGSSPVGAEVFYRTHPMAQRYGSLGRSGDSVLTLRDDAGTVLSLPPVLNAAGAGEIRPGDRQVLLESTGTVPARTREMVGYLLLPFVARGWKVHPVPVHRSSGSDDGSATVGLRSMTVSPGEVNALLGCRLGLSEVEGALRKARLHAQRDGPALLVRAPPWRADLLSATDLAEEVAIAQGLGSFPPVLPPSVSLGSRRAETHFQHHLLGLALGLGYQEMFTPILIPPATAEGVAAGDQTLAVANPVTAEFTHVRPSLRASLLEVLGLNTRAGYPQRVCELAYVVVRDPTTDTGTRTEVHLALLDAGGEAGFARSAGVAAWFLEALALTSGREPAELPGTIPGRSAVHRVAGDSVAWMGEIHPRELDRLGIPEPVSFLELDLTALHRLRGGDPPAG